MLFVENQRVKTRISYIKLTCCSFLLSFAVVSGDLNYVQLIFNSSMSHTTLCHVNYTVINSPSNTI